MFQQFVALFVVSLHKRAEAPKLTVSTLRKQDAQAAFADRT
jgi:hypothetical protein